MTTATKATLSEAVALCKSAGVLAGDHDGGEVISVEVADLYEAGYAQFEELIKEAPETDRAEIFSQWGIALTYNFRLVFNIDCFSFLFLILFYFSGFFF